MCNDYAREIESGRVVAAMEEMKHLPPFDYHGNRIPNAMAPTPHIRIRDKGWILRLHEDCLVGSMTTWAWLQGKRPVFNFVSEGRDFSKNDRCLILATSFYEYTTPEQPKVKLQDRHQFTLKGSEWFWIAGIVKNDAFMMLTVEPGPDMQRYHDRQIAVLPFKDGFDWLTRAKPQTNILKPLPLGSLTHRLRRKNGVPV